MQTVLGVRFRFLGLGYQMPESASLHSVIARNKAGILVQENEEYSRQHVNRIWVRIRLMKQSAR